MHECHTCINAYSKLEKLMGGGGTMFQPSPFDIDATGCIAGKNTGYGSEGQHGIHEASQSFDIQTYVRFWYWQKLSAAHLLRGSAAIRYKRMFKALQAFLLFLLEEEDP